MRERERVRERGRRRERFRERDKGRERLKSTLEDTREARRAARQSGCEGGFAFKCQAQTTVGLQLSTRRGKQFQTLLVKAIAVACDAQPVTAFGRRVRVQHLRIDSCR
eukprot:6182098-Pleurochrysis_carterae.AAC.2